MATNSIFTNTSSGIDYQKIVDGFTKIESARADRLQQKTVDVTTRMSTLATMMGQARDLEDALTSLSTGVPLGIVGRQPLNVEADVAADAPAGRYNVKVNTLAQAAQGRTQTFASADAAVATGTYNFVVDGKSFDFTLGAGATLSTLASKIAESGAPVQVSLINTGTGTTLSLVGSNTGVSNGVAEADQLRLTPPDPLAADAPSFTVTQKAQNATIVVNGVDISRTTNVIDDVIPGVTLRTTNEGASETFEVGRDTTGLTDKVQVVVDTYNALRRAVKNQVEVVGGTDTAQLLTNDPVVRRLNRQMSDMLRIDVGAGSIRSLASVGLNVARDGTLEFNAGKLKTAIIVDPTAVTNFLSGPTGYASRARTMISQFSNPLSGALSKRTFELSDDISKIQKEKAAADLKVEAFRDRLVRQFSTLQSVQSQMSGLTNFLKANDNAANKS